MRQNHRPYWIKRIFNACNRFYVRRWLKPQFRHLGEVPAVFSPRHVKVAGAGVSVGDFVLLFAAPHAPIQLTTWHHGDGDGEVLIGNCVLLTPGVRIIAAKQVRIDDDCMLASDSYISDCDWHGIYNRVSSLGEIRPVHLQRNVWIGSRAIICKGVNIGENSIVGAGAVVTADVPADTIVAGIPARPIGKLDQTTERRVRSQVLTDALSVRQTEQALERMSLAGNTTFGWLRSLLLPNDRH